MRSISVTGQHWTDSLLSKYPHTIRQNSEVPDAIELYRKILSSQPDHSVVIITVGFLTNLSNLLQSGPDSYSPLDGQALVRQKVQRLVSMAGSFPKGKEFNVFKDAKASLYVFTHWPGPVLFSGFEIGKKIKCGLPLIHDETIRNSPVKDAFRICIPLAAEDAAGRSSWDETAVLVGVMGYIPYYKTRPGRIQVAADGSNTWLDADNSASSHETGQEQSYLLEDKPAIAVQDLIDRLIRHQPVANIQPLPM
jgi:inosine-uridine nucleoside N-ribohydrolase